MAAKLELSLHAYANIEQGNTDVQLSRLEQIAQVLGMDEAEDLRCPGVQSGALNRAKLRFSWLVI